MPRLLLVTGKGGTGKTTVAAALALAHARRGGRVILARLGRHVGPPPPVSIPVESVEGEPALAEYLGLVLGARLAGRVTRASLYRRFVAAAPGLRELMALGKVADLARGGAWDTVVVDTPSSGHLLQMLRMPAAALALFGGLVAREARRLVAELGDPAHTRVVPVTVLEALSLGETRELEAALASLGVTAGRPIVNRVHEAPLEPDAVPAAPPGAPPLLGAVLRDARAEAARAARDRARLAALADRPGPPPVILPRLPRLRLTGEDLAVLAGALERQEAPRGGGRRRAAAGDPSLGSAERPVARPPERDTSNLTQGAVTLARLAAERRVIVCLGGGGVGKTTVAAALALAGARAGRRAVVVTVDPARRLADALGGVSLDDAPRPVPVPGLPEGGRLEAAMLDQKRAWDRLVARHARTPAIAERLLANRLYRELSASFAGTHEALAVERLGALVDAGAHDLIVLDTPPAAQAVAILEMPARLSGLTGRRALAWIRRGGHASGRLARFLTDELSIAIGETALGDALDFLAALAALSDGLAARTRQLEGLLAQASTALVLVAAPDGRAAADAALCAERAGAVGGGLAALVLNRVHPALPEASPRAVAGALEAAGVVGPHARWMIDGFLARGRLAAEEAAEAARLAHLAPAVVSIRDLEEDVHDLDGLARILGAEVARP